MSESAIQKDGWKITARRWGVRIVIGLAVYTALGFFALPALVQWQLPVQASDALGRQVTLDAVRFNPFSLSLSLTGLRVAEADGQQTAAQIGHLDTDLQWRSLYYWGLVFSRLNIDAPTLRLTRLADGRHNWSDVVERLTRPEPRRARPEVEPGPPRFSINNIQITGGSIDIDDQPAGVTHTVRDLALGVPFVSGFPAEVERHVLPALSARVNDTPLQVDGYTRPFGEDLQTVIDVRLDGLDLTTYLAYLPFEPAFEVPTGTLSVALELAFSEPQGLAPRLMLAGNIALTDLAVRHRDGRPAIRLPKVSTVISEYDVFGQSLRFERIEIDQPALDLNRLADGSLDVMQLMPSLPADTPAEAEAATEAPAGAFLVTIDQLDLNGGQVRFSDAAAPANAFKTELTDIQVSLTGLVTNGSRPAQLSVGARSAAGEQLALQGELALAPLRTSGTLSLTDIPLTHYQAYYAQQLVAARLTGGTLAATLPYVLDDAGFRLDQARIDLAKAALQLDKQRTPAARIDALSVEGIDVDVAARSVSLARVTSGGGALAMVRGRDGRIDLAQIVAPAGEAPAPDTPAWDVRIGQTALSGWTLRFEDRAVSSPVVIQAERTAVSLGPLATAQRQPVTLSVESIINQGGYLAAKGRVDPASLAADLRVDIKRLGLRPLQAYATEGIEASLRSADLSLAGQLSVGAAGGGEAPPVRFRGAAAIDDLIAVDTGNDVDVLTWKRLAVSGLDVRTAPLALAADEIALSDFFSRLVLSAEGRLNFREMTAAEKNAAAAQAEVPEATQRSASVMPGEFDGGSSRPAAAPTATATVSPPSPALPPIRIGRIVVDKGNVAFSDRFVQPNYDANLTEVAGTLEGLSSDPESLATLSLTAAIDHAAPVTITGQLNPLRDDRYLDIAASMRGFDLPTVSPYSGKYVGYGIAKGKLSADLSYKITDRTLSAENNILLDQLTFGEAVDSPDAVNLPVQLAVALLKNSKGEINLSVPVGGSLDDPKFSVAGLVWRAFFNLIAKAVTSPFALLGSVFGGGEELSYAEFAPGTHRLTPETVKKLETLAKALADRPALKIDITGRVEPAADEAGLREQWLLERMRARQREALLDAGQTPPPLDDIEIPTDRRDVLLAEAYDEADFDGKPRNFIGLSKSIPADQMRALMLKNAPVSETELAALGKARAQAVRDWLVGVGKVNAERIFMVGPSAAGKPEAVDKKDVVGSRVDFSLK
ncbi:DUF748 domain-containing protein [Denitromonas sp.]|uniref:DUF748 domain-containing protein n=1 Tax=Denitromonas sp. TaxID=2734609 RepID=UPI003A884497